MEMEINGNTRISDLIRHRPASVDAIAALSKPLEKLKNPILRRIMASRVTIAQAAVMGRCTIADFRAALTPLGFHFVDDSAVQQPAGPLFEDGAGRPGWLPEKPDLSTHRDASSKEGTGILEMFDVRPIIGSGNDPLRAILERFKALPQGHILCILNGFVPYPLIGVLEKQGAQSFVESREMDLHYTYFYKDRVKEASAPGNLGEKGSDPADKESASVLFHDAQVFSYLTDVHREKLWKEIDVRHMEMPIPMYTILEELENLPAGKSLYVQHKRVPVFLLESLAEKTFKVHIFEAGYGDTRMLITNPQ